MATNPIPTIPETRAAAQELENQLAAANPVGETASQAVADSLEAVVKVLTVFNQDDALLRTGEMQAVAPDLSDAMKKLKALQAQLAEIGKDLGTVGDVAGALDTVLTGCGSLFKI